MDEIGMTTKNMAKTSQAGTFCCTDEGGRMLRVVLHGDADDFVRPVALRGVGGGWQAEQLAGLAGQFVGAQCAERSAGLVAEGQLQRRVERRIDHQGQRLGRLPVGPGRGKQALAEALGQDQYQGIAAIADGLPGGIGLGRRYRPGENCRSCSGGGPATVNGRCRRDRRWRSRHRSQRRA